MRSLFVKIFLWFWLATTLVGIASIIFAIATQSYPLLGISWLRFLAPAMQRERETAPPLPPAGRERMQPPPPPAERETAIPPLPPDRETPQPPHLPRIRIMKKVLELSGQTAAEIFERNGKAAFIDYADRLEQTTSTRLFLFDGQNGEVSGRTVPEGVKELAARVAKSGKPVLKPLDGILSLAYEAAGPGKNSYIVVVQISDRPIGLFDYEPYALALHLITLLATAGMVCYWLARYITTPIRKLQTAARRLAEGDLRVRVGEMVGKRKDEIADLGKDFDFMAERIESLLAAQKRLLRDISHELRSPLTRLGIALELARQRTHSEAQGPLDRIGREAARLNELIGQVLVLARLESSVEKTDNESVSLLYLVQEIAADAEFEAHSRNRTVRIVSGEACIISGTKELLRSAIENIVRNAVHYTDEGTAVEITIRSEPRDGYAQALIEVRDHGPGVPDEALTDLFRPFYRVGESRDRKRGGVGLGLAIAERAVKLHGGTVEAANAPDGGLIVTVRFPLGAS